MTIATGLSVPIFNVLKYFFIIVFIETIARGALNNVYLFLRKFDLYKGKGTALSGSRIDRYDLLQVVREKSVMRVGLWILLVTCFYAVEILFEFSSDAVSQMLVRTERKLVFDASYSACQSFDWLPTRVAYHMSTMAKSCVDLTEEEYILYTPLWIKQESVQQSEIAHCAKVPKNELRRGKRIYSDRRFTKGTASWDAVADIITALKTNASTTNDYKHTSQVIITVSSSDILFLENLQFSGNQSSVDNLYRIAFLAVQVPSRTSSLLCGGLIYGAVGEGVFRVVMYACTENSTSGLHYMQVTGTAPVLLETDRVQKDKWSVDVVVYFGIAIRNFTKGILNSRDEGFFTKMATYATLLSAAYGKDSDSLNQYAAIYKHCDLLKVAQPWDKAQWREVEYISPEMRITVLLSEWGLALVVCWSVTLWISATLCLRFADRNEMPGAVDGEIGIARRWATQEANRRSDLFTTEQQNTSKKSFKKLLCFQSAQAYLNVVSGTDFDDIVASQVPVNTKRDTSKPFREV